MPPNHRLLSDAFKNMFIGSYIWDSDSTDNLSYSFTEGYLSEKSPNNEYDFYYAINDSTFRSLVGWRTLKFRLENDRAVAFQASYEHAGDVQNYVRLEE